MMSDEMTHAKKIIGWVDSKNGKKLLKLETLRLNETYSRKRGERRGLPALLTLTEIGGRAGYCKEFTVSSFNAEEFIHSSLF